MSSKITFADKVAGSQFFAADAQEIKEKVNLNADSLDADIAALLALKAGSSETIASLKALIDTLTSSKASATTVNNILTLLGIDSSGNAVTDINTVVDTVKEVLATYQNFPEGANIAALLSQKVDKETGKSLLSDTEITKLSGIATGATNNVKASVSDLESGTDDTKFITPLLNAKSKARSKYLANKKTYTQANVLAIPNCIAAFTPDSGFYSDEAATIVQSTDGGVIKCWKNAANNSKNATSSGTGFILNQNGINGRDAVKQTGTGLRLRAVDLLTENPVSTEMTVFMVVQNPYSVTNDVAISSSDGRFRMGWNQTPGTNAQENVFSAASTITQSPKLPIDIRTSANIANGTAKPSSVLIQSVSVSTTALLTEQNFHGYINRVANAGNALNVSGDFIIGGLSAAFPWKGDVGAVIIFNRLLTPTEKLVVNGYLESKFNEFPDALLYVSGNSLVAGTASSTGVVTYPGPTSTPFYASPSGKDVVSQFNSLYNADGRITVRMEGYPGRKISQMIDEIPLTLNMFVASASNRKRVVVFWEFANSVPDKMNENYAAYKAGTEPYSYTEMANLCGIAKNAGWIVLVGTMIPRGDTSDDKKLYAVQCYVNTWLKNNYMDICDGIVAFDSDPRIGKPGAEQITTTSILTLGSITAGSGYTNGSYVNVPLTGGAGTQAAANITVAGGVVTAVTLMNPGSGYVIGNALSALAANIGGTGSGFSVPVASLNAGAFFSPDKTHLVDAGYTVGAKILYEALMPVLYN